jgi:hypothetical protein
MANKTNSASTGKPNFYPSRLEDKLKMSFADTNGPRPSICKGFKTKTVVKLASGEKDELK